MLVLSRYIGESIIIGTGPNKVRIVIVDIPCSNKVRIGIEAPKDMPIDRLEIFEEKYGPAGYDERKEDRPC